MFLSLPFFLIIFFSFEQNKILLGEEILKSISYKFTVMKTNFLEKLDASSISGIQLNQKVIQQTEEE